MRRGSLLGLTLLVLAAVTIGCGDRTVGPFDSGPREAGPDQQKIDQRVDGLPDGRMPDLGKDGPPPTCTARVESINGKAATLYNVLTSADDQDKAQPGFQINVEVSLIGKPDGTPIQLFVTGLSPEPSQSAAGGKATFTGVTVDSTLAVVTIRPEVAGCAGAALVLNVQADPACTFQAPKDGVTLSQKDNKNPGAAAFIYDVKLTATNAVAGQVILRVNGAQSGSAQAPNPVNGAVVFPDITLPSQAGVKLEAEVSKSGLKATCSITVNVDTVAPACSLEKLSPAPKSTTKGDGLGPAQDADPSTPGLQTTVTVKTEPGVDKVALSYDGQTASATPASNAASFPITLGEGTKIIQATCTNSTTGNTGKSNAYQIIVDTTAPPKPTGFVCNVIDHRGGKVECVFPAASDGASGSGIENYLVHYRQDSAIDETNFDAADTIKATPVASATPVQITKLAFRHSYNFALKVVDFLGNASPLSDVAGPAVIDFKTQEILGQAAGQKFGYPVVVGDFNCDGYSDLAVGLFGANSNTGEVQLFFSSGAGLPTTYSKKISGTVASGYFGNSLAALQFDNDPDGCSDLAVVASGRDGYRGQVYLYLGRQLWTDRTDDGVGTGAEIVYKLSSAAAATEILGIGLAGADLDGDGRDDLAINHLLADAGGWSNVLIDYGEPTIALMEPGVSPATREMPGSADVQITGGTFESFFGTVLAKGGNLDGDSFGELLIGAPMYQSTGKQVGAAFVLFGKARAAVPPEIVDVSTSTRIMTIIGDASNKSFGATMAGVGDFDGDGSGELLVGDPEASFGTANQAGSAYLFHMTPAPTTAADADVIIQNDTLAASGNIFGRRLANGAEVNTAKGGDLDKDGYADIVIGAAGTGTSTIGSAFVFKGRATPPASLKTTQPDLVLSPATGGTTWFSRETTFVTDVNGDGYPDIVISDLGFASSTGKVAVYY